MYQKHGGCPEKYISEYGRESLDFSANINPFGILPCVKEAIIKEADNADRYPDPGCRELKKAISGYTGALEDHILCGNGGSDLIRRIIAVFSGKKALICIPSFAEYGTCLDIYGCRAEKYLLREEEDFRIGRDFIERIDKETALVILTEPNNPTGVMTGRDLKEAILEKCERTGSFLLIDESFIEFSDDAKGASMIKKASSDRLIILRAFTKYFGLAGLRLGYIISTNGELLGRVNKLGSEWDVNLLAQKAGIAALDNIENYAGNLDYIKSEKNRLFMGLTALGYKVFDSQADFLLFKGKPGLAEALIKEGILIRDCSSFEGLGPGWYRIAVRLHEDNERLLSSEAVKKYGIEKS